MSKPVDQFHSSDCVCSFGMKLTWDINDPKLPQVAKVLWWYYFSKLIEFLDTIFFVLRKKNNQITFLHVHHHASMFNIWWCVLNWIPCEQSFFGSTLNSFIHVLMYTYYGLSTIPSMHKFLWWKR